MKRELWVFVVCVGASLGLAFSSCKAETPPKQVFAAPKSPLVALTPAEYNNSIRDLFGFSNDASQWPARPRDDPKAKAARVSWPWSFPPETGVDKFDGIASGQAASAYKIEQLQQAARYFSAFALRSKQFLTCSSWSALEGEAQKSCGWESIRRFARRAWRRPLSDEESKRLRAFFEANWKASSPDEAIQLTVAGLLQSASFLYRVERGEASKKQGQAVPLTSWEMASRLSYFLWDSLPDAALFQAASEGKLQSRAQVAAQARRMLQDPKAREAVVRFHNQLLGLGDIHTINPSRERYGPLLGFTAKGRGPKAENDMLWPKRVLEIRQSMLREVELFVERTVFDGAGTLRALLTDHHGYMSTQTQVIYGAKARLLPGPTVAWESAPVIDVFGFPQVTRLTLSPAEFPKSQRAGLLTMPAVLALYSHPVHPSPILRGKFILTRLACQPMGAPPASAFGKEPPDAVKVQGTNRERTEQVTKVQGCNSCHKSLNPPGYALENYDSLGRWRDKDNGKVVDARATIALGSERFEVKDPIELAHKLSTSAAVQSCYALRWLRVALGLQLHSGDPGVKALQQAFQKNDNVKELLVSIASSDLFRYRSAGGSR